MAWIFRFKKRKRWFVKLGVIRNTLDQSNFRILKSAITQEQLDHAARFFPC